MSYYVYENWRAKGHTAKVHVGSPQPVYVTLTLIGMKGKQLSNDGAESFPGEAPKEFDRDVITSPDVLIQSTDEGAPFPTTLLPIVNSIWQAAGFPGTIHARNGRWDPDVSISY